MNRPPKYFIYCRKSSEDEDRQMLSIEAQLEELHQLARERGFQVVQVFTESKSALVPGREIFADMIRRIESGEANGILCWSLNRLARNFDEAGRVIGLLQRETISAIHTPEKTYLPSDNVLMIAVEFGMANQYSRDLAKDIRRGIREKIRRGIYSGKAPLGYFNEPKLRTIEPHPTNFAKVKKILGQFATAEYSLTAIQRALATAGIIGEPSKKPLPLSSIGKLLRNPFYYGVFVQMGEMHQGAHVPMISKETFENIQKALVAVGKPRGKRDEKGFLFLNFATCGSCGSAITAEKHVKKSGLRFDYYRCTRKNRKCPCDEPKFTRAACRGWFVGLVKNRTKT